MKNHINIPIFIPHVGCPNMCVFCNQRTISGVEKFDINCVKTTIENSLSTISSNQTAEIAFFGGSFTGIDEGLMLQLLEIAYEYVKSGRVASVRCSTRPDYVNEHILSILKKFGVRTIELGLQSVDENVLCACKRGHTFEDEKRACDLIINFGFDLVGQMMIGLPCSDLQSEITTADFIINSKAKAARIYPTIVFRDTELYEMTLAHEYSPITLYEAIERSSIVMQKLISAKVDVIRVGLCDSESLHSEKTYYSGPNHAALGELVMGEVYYKIIRDKLNKTDINNFRVTYIKIARNSLSKAIGQKKINYLRLKDEFPNCEFCFQESDELKEYEVLIEGKREDKKCT